MEIRYFFTSSVSSFSITLPKKERLATGQWLVKSPVPGDVILRISWTRACFRVENYTEVSEVDKYNFSLWGKLDKVLCSIGN